MAVRLSNADTVEHVEELYAQWGFAAAEAAAGAGGAVKEKVGQALNSAANKMPGVGGAGGGILGAGKATAIVVPEVAASTAAAAGAAVSVNAVGGAAVVAADLANQTPETAAKGVDSRAGVALAQSFGGADVTAHLHEKAAEELGAKNEAVAAAVAGGMSPEAAGDAYDQQYQENNVGKRVVSLAHRLPGARRSRGAER